MRLPKAVENLIEAFERLPGIGPKTAARLTYYLLHAPPEFSQKLGRAAYELKSKTTLCSVCKNITEVNPCPICSDTFRNQSTICVVEEPLDVVAIEKSGAYKGFYHVLHGRIAPLSNIGPEDIFIKELVGRIKNGKVSELILATNFSMEGEATAMYIQRLLASFKLKITRIAQGIPTGGDLEYADEQTLRKALEGRQKY